MNKLINHMHAHGLAPDSGTVFVSGSFQRYSADDKKDRDEWYIINDLENGHILACYGSHSASKPAGPFVYKSYEDDFMPLSPEEQARITSEMIEKAEMIKKSREKQYAEGATKAEALYASAEPAGAHPYLEKKGIEAPLSVRLLEGSLVVPITNLEGRFQSLQFIGKQGGKKFFEGAKASGGVFMTSPIDEGREIFVGEGFATCETAKMTGLQVVCAFSSAGATKIAHDLKKKHPKTRVAILGDIGTKYDFGDVVYPTFKNSPDKGADFNDLYLAEGLETVKAQLSIRSYSGMNIEDFLAQDIPPIDWIYEDFLHTGSTNILYARDGQGKSRFAMELAYHAACGADFAGYKCLRPRNVLYIEGEMTHREIMPRLKDIQRRCEQKGCRPKRKFTIITKEFLRERDLPSVDLSHPKCRLMLEKLLGDHEFIIFDNLICLTTPSSGESFTARDKDSKIMIDWLGNWKQRDKAALMIGHANQSGNLYGQITYLKADLSVCIRLEAESGGGFIVSFEKHRNVKSAKSRNPFVLKMDAIKGDWVKSEFLDDDYEDTKKKKKTRW